MSDDLDDRESLSFPVSPENLSEAIDLLRTLGGLTAHPEVYQALVVERSRRELLSPPREIRVTREAFAALPPAVRRLLTAEPC
jgi:hypothetical protein